MMWPVDGRVGRISNPHGLLAGVLAVMGVMALAGGLLLLFPPTARPIVDRPTIPTPELTPAGRVTSTPQATAGLTPRPTVTPPPTSTPTPVLPTPTPPIAEQVIGYSVQNRAITVVRFGYGERTIVLIGGINSGFAPSGIALARRFMTYFQDHLADIPADVSLYILVDGNPDSVYAPGRREGRLNANGVDLNRNWDCDWRHVAQFERQPISGGDAPLSEPESRALHDFLLTLGPDNVIIYTAFFTGGFVSPGYCGDYHAPSQALGDQYGAITGYTVGDYTTTELGPNGGAYVLNGDATNSLSSAGIATISVLLTDHVAVDWDPNLKAVLALLSGD